MATSWHAKKVVFEFRRKYPDLYRDYYLEAILRTDMSGEFDVYATQGSPGEDNFRVGYTLNNDVFKVNLTQAA